MTDEERKAKFLLVEQLKMEIKEREDELETLLPALLTTVKVGDKINTGSGTFSVECRNKYRYSQELVEQEERLKADKKNEEQTGEAEVIPGEPYLKYRANT